MKIRLAILMLLSTPALTAEPPLYEQKLTCKGDSWAPKRQLEILLNTRDCDEGGCDYWGLATLGRDGKTDRFPVEWKFRFGEPLRGRFGDWIFQWIKTGDLAYAVTEFPPTTIDPWKPVQYRVTCELEPAH